jgi:septum site-determining protein MinC
MESAYLPVWTATNTDRYFMMTGNLITIKGVKDGLLITLSTTEEWQLITEELASRIDEQGSFFSGAKITVNLGERPVPKYELSSLKAVLERRGLLLASVQSSSQTTLQSAEALDLRIRSPESVADTQPVGSTTTDSIDAPLDPPIDPEEHGTPGVLVKRTLRSGRTIHSRGHVVVYGDVNPGAKIVATGDIIVWGKLRGMVHAGAEGNTEAVICALEMNPNQLRIADLIAMSPDDSQQDSQPEVASVRHNQIVVEAWN